MKQIIISIIMLALTISLVIGVIMPITNGIKTAGNKSVDSVKNLNENIKQP